MRTKKEKVEKPKYTRRLNLVSSSLQVELNKSRTEGRARVICSFYDRKISRREIRITLVMPVISVWVNPTSNEIAKLHLTVPQERNCLDFAGSILEENAIGDGSKMQYMTNRNRTVIRYGHNSVYQFQDNDDYRSIFIYNSKAEVVKQVIEFTKMFLTVGGSDLVDFQMIDDKLLADLGFTEVKDEMRSGPSMWLGSVEDLVGSGSQNIYSQEAGIKTSNAKSFFELLSKSVGKK